MQIYIPCHFCKKINGLLAKMTKNINLHKDLIGYVSFSERLDELEILWKQLLEQSERKGKYLRGPLK